eukprot:10676535-Lingulodinium_polyedra.AAC.1
METIAWCTTLDTMKKSISLLPSWPDPVHVPCPANTNTASSAASQPDCSTSCGVVFQSQNNTKGRMPPL